MFGGNTMGFYKGVECFRRRSETRSHTTGSFRKISSVYRFINDVIHRCIFKTANTYTFIMYIYKLR
jgi:hypothetical protein